MNAVHLGEVTEVPCTGVVCRGACIMFALEWWRGPLHASMVLLMSVSAAWRVVVGVGCRASVPWWRAHTACTSIFSTG